jgi:hypothetical protein
VEEEGEEEEEEEGVCPVPETPRGCVNCDNQTVQTTSSSNQNNNVVTSDSSDVGLCILCDKLDSDKHDSTKFHENGSSPITVRKESGKGPKRPMIRAFNIPYIFECK